MEKTYLRFCIYNIDPVDRYVQNTRVSHQKYVGTYAIVHTYICTPPTVNYAFAVNFFKSWRLAVSDEKSAYIPETIPFLRRAVNKVDGHLFDWDIDLEGDTETMVVQL